MPISVVSEFVPTASGVFPVVDVGNVKGGYQSVADTTERDAISLLNRKVGMVVHVRSSNTSYRLTGGITNSDWLVESGGQSYASGFSGSSVTFTHNLGFLPVVQIIDVSGAIYMGQINHLSPNSLTVNFSTSIAATGYMS